MSKVKVKKDKRESLWKKQRKTRGFDDTELWNLDHTIAKFILPRLKAFRDGNPIVPFSHETKELWQKDLDKMVECFRLLAGEECFSLNKKQCKAIDKGLKLFCKNFHKLWW